MKTFKFLYVIILAGAIGSSALFAENGTYNPVIHAALEIGIRCPLCEQSLITDGKITDEEVLILPCKKENKPETYKGHFVHKSCYLADKNKLLGSCPYPKCNKVFSDTEQQILVKTHFPKHSKNLLKKHTDKVAEYLHKKRDRLNNLKNCGICRKDQDAKQFCPIGCTSKHEYCFDCLPKWLNKYETCPDCREQISPYVLKDNQARKQGHFILPSQLPLVRKVGSVGISFFIVPWIAHNWSKYRLRSSLDTLNSSAQTKMNVLLNFEFDRDDSTVLGLQDSYNIKSLMTLLKNEQRTDLQTAIEEYDKAFNATYARIVRAYYYQPAANFAHKEARLVQNLKNCAEKINQLTTKYTQELGNPLRNMVLGMGAGLLSGAGLLYFTQQEGSL